MLNSSKDEHCGSESHNAKKIWLNRHLCSRVTFNKKLLNLEISRVLSPVLQKAAVQPHEKTSFDLIKTCSCEICQSSI